MTANLGHFPSSGVRQPRIIYKLDDPAMADLEELRRVFSKNSMNAVYLEALLIGARQMLGRYAGVADASHQSIAPTASAQPQVQERRQAVDSGSTQVGPSLHQERQSSGSGNQGGMNQPIRSSGIPLVVEPDLRRSLVGTSSVARNMLDRFG